jgi:hypothetical protein
MMEITIPYSLSSAKLRHYFHSGYTGSISVGDCPLQKSCSGRFQAHAATLSSGYSWCRPPKVGKARTLCSVSGKSLHRAACSRFGYRKSQKGICGLKVFRVCSPPSQCLLVTYCPYSIAHDNRYARYTCRWHYKRDALGAVWERTPHPAYDQTSTRSVQLERFERAFACFSVANRAAKSTRLPYQTCFANMGSRV